MREKVRLGANTGHSESNVCFSVDYVRYAPESGRSAGVESKSANDPKQTSKITSQIDPRCAVGVFPGQFIDIAPGATTRISGSPI